jgi:uncharacterized protein YkwD
MSRTTTIAALAAIAAVTLAGCATSAPETTTQAMSASAAPPPTAMGCQAGAVQRAVLQRINEARQAGLCGDARLGPVRPLTWQPALASTASRRAGEIAQRGTFGNVADVAPRLRQDGYAATSSQETQVAGDFSSDGATQALLAQHKQCTTLLNPEFTDIGAACVTRPGSEFKHYWTVVVAKGTPAQATMGAGPAKKKAAVPERRTSVKAKAKTKAAEKPQAGAKDGKVKVKDAKVLKASKPAKGTGLRATSKPAPAAKN